jgi:ABC-type Mn2+/Zn2+ transport system ATPase subunit
MESGLLNAWDFDVKIKQILSRLKSIIRPKISTLSGGQQKRVLWPMFDYETILLVLMTDNTTLILT